jgi:hypothetical protein
MGPKQMETVAGCELGRLSKQANPPSGDMSRGNEGLDSFTLVHNNTVMNTALLAPVIVLLNIAGSSGATG